MIFKLDAIEPNLTLMNVKVCQDSPQQKKWTKLPTSLNQLLIPGKQQLTRL
ncbi:MAG: hypothetical protein AAF298_02700 [Cyanobacteria bacterium P01_A01_bin.40]